MFVVAYKIILHFSVLKNYKSYCFIFQFCTISKSGCKDKQLVHTSQLICKYHVIKKCERLFSFFMMTVFQKADAKIDYFSILLNCFRFLCYLQKCNSNLKNISTFDFKKRVRRYLSCLTQTKLFQSILLKNL